MLARLARSNRFSLGARPSYAPRRFSRSFTTFEREARHTETVRVKFGGAPVIEPVDNLPLATPRNFDELAATYDKIDTIVTTSTSPVSTISTRSVVMDSPTDLHVDSVHSCADKQASHMSKEKIEKLAHLDFNGIEAEDGGMIITTRPRSGFKGTE